MATIPGIESKVTGFLRTDLATEATTATIDVDFVNEDDNTVAIVLQSDTLEFSIDPLNETGNGEEIIFAASTAAHPTVANRTRLSTVQRGLLQYGTGQTGASATAKSWSQGTKVAVSTSSLMRASNIVKSRINAIYPSELVLALPTYADDTARDAAITSPVNGYLIYNTAEGLDQKYVGGAWENGSNASTSNASETVAGKVELSTVAEQGTATSTGGTGARLVPANSNLVKDGTFTPAFLTGGTGAEGTYGAWTTVSDGSFRITVDGTAYNVDAIDFSGDTSMADVAATIQADLRTATSALETVTWSTDHFILSSVDTASTSAVTVTSTSSGTVGTDISGAGASNWMDCDTGNGTVTNKVADFENKLAVMGSDGLDSEMLRTNYRGIETGTTDATGTELETLTDGSDAGALHTHAVKIGRGVWDVTGNGETETIAHGLGRIPKLVTIYWFANTTDTIQGQCFGTLMYDGTSNECALWSSVNATTGTGKELALLEVRVGGVTKFTATVTTMDATNVILTSAGYTAAEGIDYAWRVE